MLEDSINSSPQSKRSIHVVRMHRKNRRWRAPERGARDHKESDQSAMETSSCSGTVHDRSPKLLDLYAEDTDFSKDSDLDTTFLEQTQQNVVDFDPFEDEMLLAVADRLDRVKEKKSKEMMDMLKAGRGFISCTQLMEEKAVETPPLPQSTINDCKATIPRFEITESELLNCCAAVENQVDTVPKSPKKQKSIIDAILEDFCSSPDSLGDKEEPCLNNNKSATSEDGSLLNVSPKEDGTLSFQYKSKALRTYSRRSGEKRAHADLGERLVDATPAYEEDNISSCSSGLSIQEDLTQPTESHLHTIDLDKSMNVCENLLNLSAYFSQQSVPDSVSITSEELDPDTPEIRTQNCDKSVETCTAANTQPMEVIVTSQDNNCNQISVEKQGQPDPNINEDSCNDSNLQGFVGSPPPKLKEDETTTSSTLVNLIGKCDSISKHNLLKEDEDVFREEESEWNDECNFFENFKTQDILKQNFSSNETDKKGDFNGFTTASNKVISVSDNAKQKATQMLAEVDAQLTEDFKATQNVCIFSQTKTSALKAPTEGQSSAYYSNEFMTASQKVIPISDKGKQKAAQMLAQVNAELEEDFKATQNVCIFTQTKKSAFKKPTNPPERPLRTTYSHEFMTASQKVIPISDRAKQRGARMLAEVDAELKHDYKVTQNVCVLSQTKRGVVEKSANPPEVPSWTHSYNGFMTASQKVIPISDKAKQKAAQMLAQVNAELEEDFKATQNVCIFSQTKASPCRMPTNQAEITLSSEKLTNKIKDFKTVSMKGRNDAVNSIQTESVASADLGDIQLSEWLIAEDDEGKENNFKPCIATSDLKTSNEAPCSSSTSRISTASSKSVALAEAAENTVRMPDFLESNSKDAECQFINDGYTKCDHKENTSKRKFQHEESKEETLDQSAKILCKSHTANTMDNISLSSPLARNSTLTSLSKSDRLSRKNLLTLNKRKKVKTRSDTQPTQNENLTTTSTPLKSSKSCLPTESTPVTPNVKEFFASVSNSSTPHSLDCAMQESARNVKQADVSENMNQLDADFQHIEWDTCNDTSALNKTQKSLNSTSAVTKQDSEVPSPKLRVERLSKYGNPPPISPILMATKNNCRPSGLRRGRSLLKPN